VHDGQRVAHAQQFRQVTGDPEDGLALGGQLADEGVDVGLGAHVDAARRLVQEQHVGLLMQQPRQRHLLLVPAREARNRLVGPLRADAEAPDPLAGRLACAAAAQQAERDVGPEAAEGQVIDHRQVLGQAFGLAVLRQVPDAARQHPRGLPAGGRDALDADLAADDFVEAEDGPHQFRPAGADEPGNAEDLAAAEHQVRMLRHLAARQGREVEDRLADVVRRAVVHVGEFAADHEADDLGGRRRGHVARAYRPAVAEDREPVGHRPDLLQKMADVDDADARVAERADHLEQHVRIGLRETRGRLVHDDHVGLGGQRPGHLHQLLGADREVADPRPRADVAMVQQPQRLFNLAAHVAAADEAEGRRFDAQEDVFLDREVGRQAQFLVDHRDAGGAGVERPARRVRPALQDHAPGVGLKGAGEDLHEGALAGAVLADEGVDLAGANVEVHLNQRPGRAEGLGDADHAKRERRRPGGGPFGFGAGCRGIGGSAHRLRRAYDGVRGG